MRRDLIHQIDVELRNYEIKVDCDKLERVCSQYSDDDIERVLDAFYRFGVGPIFEAMKD